MADKRYFILVGDMDAWNISLQINTWGFSERSRGNWNTLEEGDYVAFYVTAPLKKIIGFGIITRKFINDALLWSDEKLFDRSIWKYRIQFRKLFLVNSMQEGVPVPHQIMLNTGRKVIDRRTFLSLIKQFRIDMDSIHSIRRK